MTQRLERTFDVLIIGGGIAGVSVAYELATDHRVALIEMEPVLAHHTTGRSAAAFLESYGGPIIRALTTASRSFLMDPPDGFDGPLMTPRPLLWIAPVGRGSSVVDHHGEVHKLVSTVELVSGPDAEAMFPLLRPGWTEQAMIEPEAMDMDVHAIHQGYVRGLRGRGGAIHVSTPAISLSRDATGWHIETPQGAFHAPLVINAAGAWADVLATRAGVRPIGIHPLRRTIFMVNAPAGIGPSADWPLVGDLDGTFYMKPEGTQFLCSPADETSSEPCDARPEEADIARALDIINDAMTINARHVRSSWAGLRNFVIDRVPVAGFDDEVEGWFWLVGQGGYGIQTAPALARSAASLIRSGTLPDDVVARGAHPADLHRSRLVGAPNLLAGH
jgi:D-arginine dehydrogenase